MYETVLFMLYHCSRASVAMREKKGGKTEGPFVLEVLGTPDRGKKTVQFVVGLTLHTLAADLR